MTIARQCSHELPTGKICRQVALKDEQFCRHHMRPFRHGMYQITHDEAMERLQLKLDSLNLPDLFRVLQAKLNQLSPSLRYLPEAQLALNATIDRFRQIFATDTSNSNFPETPFPSIN